MKRNIIAIMMVMVALLATQCKKSAEPLANEPAGETMEVTVRVENSTAKTEITAAGVVEWKKGDKLYVVGAEQGLLGHVSAVSDGDPVQFEGKITALTSAQVLRFYYVGDKEFTLDGSGNYTFDLSSQDGTLAGIAAHSQLMFGKTSNGVAVGTTDFGTIAMTSLMAIAHLNITGNTSNTVTVTGGFATSTFNAKIYDGATLTGAEGTITMTSASAIGNCYLALLPGTQTLTFSSGANEAKLPQKDVAANKFYNSESAIEVEIIEGVLPGLFTVGEGKHVRFSKGNLQYNMNITSGATKWRFAPNQYDIIGDENQTNVQNISATTDTWIDLFGWGTSGYDGKNPYMTSTTPSLYGNGNTNISGTDYDWGVYNAISNGGGQPGKWRTLTGGDNGEWNYLLKTRTVNGGTGQGKSYLIAIVCGKQGIILYPDDYTAQNTEQTSYAQSVWATMESNGCVFLPDAGYRDPISTHAVGSQGYYWSSSYYDSDRAYSFDFANGVSPDYYDSFRRNGFSVRLVKDAN